MSRSEQRLATDEVVTDEVTPEALDNRRERIAELHRQIADTEAEKARLAASAEVQIVAAQLDTEIAVLEARLSAAKATTKESVVKGGASGPLAAAKAEMERAKVLAEATPVELIDTNAESQPEGTTGATVAEEVDSVEEAERVTYEASVAQSGASEPTPTAESPAVESTPDLPDTNDDATPGA
jgi:hypothetical protein